MHWLTCISFMEFWHFWGDSLAHDLKQHMLANHHEIENQIQTSRYSNTRIPSTVWQVSLDDVAVFSGRWGSRSSYCDEKPWCMGIVFHCEKFDECYLDRRKRCSQGCGALDDTDGNTLDHNEVVGPKNSRWKNSRSDTKKACTLHQSPVDWERESKTDDPGGEIHITGCFGKMDGAKMSASRLHDKVGIHWGLLWCFWTIVGPVTSRYFGEFSDVAMAETVIAANTCQETCRGIGTWEIQQIKRDTIFWKKRDMRMYSLVHLLQHRRCNLSLFWPDLLFEVVANQVFCLPCG